MTGMDSVEASAPDDHAEMTAMAANRSSLAAITAFAERRQAGRPVRWDEGTSRAVDA